MACVAVASLVRTIELEFLQYQPRPLVQHNHLISFNKELIQSFHQKLGFLISQFDEKRMDGVEAVKHLESKLRDLAFRVEDEIEFLVSNLYDDEAHIEVGIADLVLKEEKPQRDTDPEKKTQPCVKLGQVFQTAMEEIEAIKEDYTGSGNEFSHQMQLLDQRDSWNLFSKKVKKSGGAEFEAIGRPIVEKCKGLPLAIVVVAGLFSKLSTLTETVSRRLCHAINANELARLWSAEGLVKASENGAIWANENFDVVADRHIKELMDRNLIVVSKWSCCRRNIEVFGVHDLLHAFCVKEAEKENLRKHYSNFPQRYFRWNG